jgi:hypothetical protein
LKVVQKQRSIISVLTVLLGILGYIFLELYFNFSLVDLYGNSTEDIFSKYAPWVALTEFVGRCITGFGLTLSLFGIIRYVAKYVLKLILKVTKLDDKIGGGFLLKPKKSTIVNSGLKLFFRVLFFVCIWLVFVIGLRLFIEGFVLNATTEGRQGAIRTMLFKEAYHLGLAKLSFDEDLCNKEQVASSCKLLYALIPSITYFSPRINTILENKISLLTSGLIDKKRKEKFEKDAHPLISEAHDFATKEWGIYRKNQNIYVDKAEWIEKKGYISELFLDIVTNTETTLWEQYNSNRKETDIADFSEKISTDLFKYWTFVSDKLAEDDCKKICYDLLSGRWKEFLDEDVNIEYINHNYWFESGWFERISLADIKERVRKARLKYLNNKYSFGLDLEKEAFLLHQDTQSQLRSLINDHNKEFRLPEKGDVNDRRTVEAAIIDTNKIQLEKIWTVYFSESEADLEEKNIKSVGTFVLSQSMQKKFKQILGEYYYRGFDPSLKKEAIYKQWNQTQQSNLDIIKMFTNKSKGAFEPGAIFYSISNDAVKFAVIPALAIMLSAFAVIALLIKTIFSLYGKPTSPRQFIQSLVFPSIIIFTIAAQVNSKSSATRVIQEAMLKSGGIVSFQDRSVAYLFGVSIDIESMILGLAQKIKLKNINERLTSAPFINELRELDDVVFKRLRPLIRDEVTYYDFNIAYYNENFDSLNYVGIIEKDNEIVETLLPNLFADLPIVDLLDIRFLSDHDRTKHMLDVVKNFKDPEYWLEVASPGYRKISLRKNLETRLTKALREKYPKGIAHQKWLPVGVHSGNIILIKPMNKIKSQCYFAPEFELTQIGALLKSGFKSGDIERLKCSGKLII